MSATGINWEGYPNTQDANKGRAYFYEMQAICRMLLSANKINLPDGCLLSDKAPNRLRDHLENECVFLSRIGGNEAEQILKEAYDKLYPEFRAECPGRSRDVIGGHEVVEGGLVLVRQMYAR